jgi:hypothetical protein
LTSEPAGSKFFGSNVRGIDVGVGCADECDRLGLGSRVDDDGEVVSVVGGAVSVASVQLTAKAHRPAPNTMDHARARCASMTSMLVGGAERALNA